MPEKSENVLLLNILVHANAKTEKIEKVENNFRMVDYEVYVKEPAKEGKANKSIIKLLKKEFKAEAVVILRGEKSRKKVIKIINPKKMNKEVEK